MTVVKPEADPGCARPGPAKAIGQPIQLNSPAACQAWGVALGRALQAGDAIMLEGPLGAGKTCLARGIARGLGVEGDVPSPSYPIVLVYAPPDARLAFHHVDLYRINDPEELDELGLDEARSAGAVVVEWPERMGALRWPDALSLRLVPARAEGEREGEGGEVAPRHLTASVPPAWSKRWAEIIAENVCADETSAPPTRNG